MLTGLRKNTKVINFDDNDEPIEPNQNQKNNTDTEAKQPVQSSNIMNAFKAKLVIQTDGKGENLEEVKQDIPEQNNQAQETQLDQLPGHTQI